MKIVIILLFSSLSFSQEIASETFSFFCQNGSEKKIVKVKKTNESCLIISTGKGKKVILVNEVSSSEQCDKSLNKELKKLKKEKYSCG
jgi:hypothetical protein